MARHLTNRHSVENRSKIDGPGFDNQKEGIGQEGLE